MVTEQLNDSLKTEMGEYLGKQARQMLSAQLGVSRSVYKERSGALNRALGSQSYTVDGMSVDVRFPLHIRFLDMKKTQKGRKKTTYAPIYNRYVYGYLKSAIWKKLKRAIPAHLISQWKSTVSETFTGK